MSTPRHNWWPFALNIIHDYPKRKLDYDALHEQKVTASMSGAPGGGGGESRPVEQVILRQLPPQEQREYDAVTKAMEMQRTMPKAEIRRKVVRMTLIRNTHTTAGAAMYLDIPVSEAKRYRWEFILLVGCSYGFLSQEELAEQLKAQRNHKGATKAKKP